VLGFTFLQLGFRIAIDRVLLVVGSRNG
jgi:hypothetical protein